MFYIVIAILIFLLAFISWLIGRLLQYWIVGSVEPTSTYNYYLPGTEFSSTLKDSQGAGHILNLEKQDDTS